VIIQSDSDDEDSDDSEKLEASSANSQQNNNRVVLTARADTGSKGILTVNGKIAGQKIENVIVDTGSAVSLISTSFFENLRKTSELLRAKGNFQVANGTQLTVKGAIILPIELEGVELFHKFLCVDTQVSSALIGYDFIRKHKIDILTSANCILVQNIPVLTHIYQAQRSVGVIITEDAKIFPTSEVLLVGQTEEAEAHLISETCCNSSLSL
jgi:hypothetical protein